MDERDKVASRRAQVQIVAELRGEKVRDARHAACLDLTLELGERGAAGNDPDRLAESAQRNLALLSPASESGFLVQEKLAQRFAPRDFTNSACSRKRRYGRWDAGDADNADSRELGDRGDCGVAVVAVIDGVVGVGETETDICCALLS